MKKATYILFFLTSVSGIVIATLQFVAILSQFKIIEAPHGGVGLLVPPNVYFLLTLLFLNIVIALVAFYIGIEARRIQKGDKKNVILSSVLMLLFLPFPFGIFASICGFMYSRERHQRNKSLFSHEGTKGSPNVVQTFLSASENNGRQECLPHIPLSAIATNSNASAVKNLGGSAPLRQALFFSFFLFLGLGLLIGWKIGKTVEENNAVNEISMKVRWFSEQLTQIKKLDDSALLDEYLNDIVKNSTALLYDKNRLEMGRDFFLQWDNKIQNKDSQLMKLPTLIHAQTDSETPLKKIFESIDMSNPSNVVLAAQPSVSLTAFLKELFQLCFSSDQTEQKFANPNMTEIAIGGLVFNEEFKIRRDDWDAAVDAFLIEGYLTSKNDIERKGLQILLRQRKTPAVSAFVKKNNIPELDDLVKRAREIK